MAEYPEHLRLDLDGGRPAPRPVRRCDSCEWWEEHREKEFGFCRAEPPRAYKAMKPNDEAEDLMGWWLTTFAEDWCAHWAQRPDSGDST